MNSFLSYILYSGAITLCLYLIYKWLLSKETFYRFNRAYLLTAYGVAFFALPVKSIVEKLAASPLSVNVGALTVDGPVLEGFAADTSDSLLPDWAITAIFAVYITGLIAVVVQTIVVAVHIFLTIKAGEKTKVGRFTLVKTSQSRLAPFSICGYVIVNRDDYDEADRMILAHEINHQRQLHWVDLFVAQAVIALQWFNPAAWLMRDELRSVHEYQADMAVINEGANAKEYQLLLIKKAIGAKFPALANCLNHSNLKKRITMMLKSKSSPWARMRALAA
ncbi:MAG: M56 family metallopeptidase, partial [Muribaculaceae bacterium]|nr:M56 family metallopeptidase [Muribaculaceae bacterium]